MQWHREKVIVIVVAHSDLDADLTPCAGQDRFQITFSPEKPLIIKKSIVMGFLKTRQKI